MEAFLCGISFEPRPPSKRKGGSGFESNMECACDSCVTIEVVAFLNQSLVFPISFVSSVPSSSAMTWLQQPVPPRVSTWSHISSSLLVTSSLLRTPPTSLASRCSWMTVEWKSSQVRLRSHQICSQNPKFFQGKEEERGAHYIWPDGSSS